MFKDHGVSGKKASRAGLDAMLEELKTDDTVIVFKLDRLGRSVLHLADLLEHFQREGIHFRSVSEGINTATPGGKLVYHLFSAYAEFQRDIIAENTCAGLDAARKRGSKLGRPRIVDAKTVNLARELIAAEELSVSEAARRIGVSRPTLSRNLLEAKIS